MNERNILEKVNTELKIKNVAQDGELRVKQDIIDAKDEEIAKLREIEKESKNLKK